jgi:hypothetical protein
VQHKQLQDSDSVSLMVAIRPSTGKLRKQNPSAFPTQAIHIADNMDSILGPIVSSLLGFLFGQCPTGIH